MKKLLLAIALLLTVQLGAQSLTPEKAQSGIDKAQANTQHPKKGLKPKAWIDLAKAYTDAYDAPTQSIWVGASQQEVKMLIGDQKVLSSENVSLNGSNFLLEKYEDKDVYYDEAGKIAAIIITKPLVQGDMLKAASDALKKANELATGSSDKDKVKGALEMLKQKYISNAMSYYTIGDFKIASEDFGNSVAISNSLGQIDTTIIFYTGLTAVMNKDYNRAIEYLTECLKYNYDQNGDIYSYIGDAYKSLDQIDKTKEILAEGFTKYPNNQAILVSLINAYIDSNDDPKKVLEFITIAQKNEPNNATLYYAEGNVWKNLKDFDKAMECYKKSLEVDPNFVYGYFSIGDAYYNKAVDLQTKASDEMDNAKYEALIVEFEKALEAAIEPFEKAFSITEDKEIKSVVAEYLKNIYFRFREKSSDFQANYEKYKKIAEEGA